MDKIISFIQPIRNNLKYLKWSYNSIRKNLDTDRDMLGDDFSNDGMGVDREIVEKDKNVKIHRNEGPRVRSYNII